MFSVPREHYRREKSPLKYFSLMRGLLILHVKKYLLTFMKYFVMYSYRLCKSGLHKQSPSEYQCAKPQGERERKELNVMISC